MKLTKIALSASFIIVISFLFIQCSNSKKYSKDLFVGTWREVRHGDDNSFDDKYAISISLNNNNTFSLSMPGERYPFSGTWAIADVDTTTILVLKNKLEINNRADYDDFQKNNYNQGYRRYYFFRVNKAMKGKLYLADVTTTDAYDASKEHLLKPQE